MTRLPARTVVVLCSSLRWLVAGASLSIAIAWLGMYSADFSSQKEVVASNYPTNDGVYRLYWRRRVADRLLVVHDVTSQRRRDAEAEFAQSEHLWQRDSAKRGSGSADGVQEDSIRGDLMLWNEYRSRLSFLTDTTVFFALMVSSSSEGAKNAISGQSEITLGPCRTCPDEPGVFWSMCIHDSAGWPMRCIATRLRISPLKVPPPHWEVQCEWGIPLVVDTEGIWSLGAGMQSGECVWGEWRALPLDLQVAGIIWNSVVLGGLGWSLLWMWSSWRRIRRWQRGLCVNCGHSLDISNRFACPECGKAR